MRTIHKFPVKPEMFLQIPADAKPLCIQMQMGHPQMWVELDDKYPAASVRAFVCYGTGHEMTDAEQTYIGTFQEADFNLVFHVYEIHS